MKFVKSLEHRLRAVQYVLQDVATSGNYSEGKYSRKLEEQLSMYIGRSAVIVNSCGSALYIVLKNLYRLGHAHALVQNNTFFASGAMAREVGMSVHLVDSRPDCPSMSVESLKEAWLVSPASVVVLTS